MSKYTSVYKQGFQSWRLIIKLNQAPGTPGIQFELVLISSSQAINIPIWRGYLLNSLLTFHWLALQFLLIAQQRNKLFSFSHSPHAKITMTWHTPFVRSNVIRGEDFYGFWRDHQTHTKISVIPYHSKQKRFTIDKRWKEMKVKRQIGANEAQCASPSVTQLDQSHVLIDVIARSLSRDY